MPFPKSANAALIGIGLVARPSKSRQSGNSLRCHFSASAGSPFKNARTRACMSRGTMFPTTDTTPRPPTDRIGRVRLSSPESTVRSQPAATCEAASSEPVASLTPTTWGTSASRIRVSGRMLPPVRPGML